MSRNLQRQSAIRPKRNARYANSVIHKIIENPDRKASNVSLETCLEVKRRTPRKSEKLVFPPEGP